MDASPAAPAAAPTAVPTDPASAPRPPLPAPPDALREGAVVADLTGRGDLRIDGAEAAPFLHGLVTNDVKKLRPGEGCRAAFLTPKGRMLADLVAYRTEAGLVLDCDPALPAKLFALLQKYGMFHPVAIADETLATAVVHVEGPEARGALARAGFAQLPDAPHAHRVATFAGRALRIASESRAGEPGFDLRLSIVDAEPLVELLVASGAARISPDALDAARVEAGLARWGAELDETLLPNEAWLEKDAISYSKGCYIGQETVARLKTYGHVNRHLVALRLPPDAGIGLGAEVLSGETKVGHVTSAVRSARYGATVALAFVKREHEAPGTELRVAGTHGLVPAVVAPLGAGA